MKNACEGAILFYSYKFGDKIEIALTLVPGALLIGRSKTELLGDHVHFLDHGELFSIKIEAEPQQALLRKWL